jgi:hypothetical protein
LNHEACPSPPTLYYYPAASASPLSAQGRRNSHRPHSTKAIFSAKEGWRLSLLPRLLLRTTHVPADFRNLCRCVARGQNLPPRSKTAHRGFSSSFGCKAGQSPEAIAARTLGGNGLRKGRSAPAPGWAE